MQARERNICAQRNYWDAAWPTATERAEWGILKGWTSVAKIQTRRLLANHPHMRRAKRVKDEVWFGARGAALNLTRE